MHLIDESPKTQLPSIEGLLLSRRGGEYMIARPALLWNPQADPDELQSRELRIPRERVAFYEIL